MNCLMRAEPLPTYQIMVQGTLNKQWSDWLEGVIISHDQLSENAPVTLLHSPAVDQAALRGILNKLWDLNLTLLSVKRVDG